MRRSLLVVLLVVAACGDDEATPIDAAPQPDAGGFECVTNPVTSLDILNACTDAQHVDKRSSLPLQYADGGLPPLP